MMRQNTENILRECEKQLQPLTMTDAEFRAYLEKFGESQEQLDYMRSAPIEAMRDGFLGSVLADMDDSDLKA